MKMKLSEDVTPVTDFRTKPAELLEKMKGTRRPLILTHRGRATAVLENIAEYEKKVERLELLEAIVRGLQAAEEGRLVSHETVMRKMHDLLNE
jgi:prevent-host-death family protein